MYWLFYAKHGFTLTNNYSSLEEVMRAAKKNGASCSIYDTNLNMVGSYTKGRGFSLINSRKETK